MRGYVVYWLWGLCIDPESVFPFEKPTEWQRVLNVDGLFSYFLGVSTNQYFNILWDSRSIISLLNWWNFVDFMKSWYLEIDTCLIGVSNLNCAKVDVMLAWLCFFLVFLLHFLHCLSCSNVCVLWTLSVYGISCVNFVTGVSVI